MCLFSVLLLFQIWRRLRPGPAAQKRDAGIDSDSESVAERAQEESISNKGRENHAGHHHQNDVDTGKEKKRKKKKGTAKTQKLIRYGA